MPATTPITSTLLLLPTINSGKKFTTTPTRWFKSFPKTSRMNTGRQYFPFLDNLYHGKISFDDINAAMSDSAKYYSLLVQTEIDYASRLRMKDTPLAMPILTARLAFKAKEVYVNVINGLHESPDNIRFKIIDKLSPKSSITSPYFAKKKFTLPAMCAAYIHAFFKRKILKPIPYSCRYISTILKKWIKMAANYNTLDDFLSRMNAENAQLLMKAFVNGLDKTNSLEDAVDVANSFASISNRKLRELIFAPGTVQPAAGFANTKQKSHGYLQHSQYTFSFHRFVQSYQRFCSAWHSARFIFMPNKLMRDTSGKIIIQQFFMATKMGSYTSIFFLNTFKNAGWKNFYGKGVGSCFFHQRHSCNNLFKTKPLDEKTKTLTIKHSKIYQTILQTMTCSPPS